MNDMVDKIRELYNDWLGGLIAAIAILTAVVGLRIICLFVLSNGDPEKVKKAKESVKYVIIGWIAGLGLIGLLPTFVGALQTWMQN